MAHRHPLASRSDRGDVSVRLRSQVRREEQGHRAAKVTADVAGALLLFAGLSTVRPVVSTVCPVVSTKRMSPLLGVPLSSCLPASTKRFLCLPAASTKLCLFALNVPCACPQKVTVLILSLSLCLPSTNSLLLSFSLSGDCPHGGPVRGDSGRRIRHKPTTTEHPRHHIYHRYSLLFPPSLSVPPPPLCSP